MDEVNNREHRTTRRKPAAMLAEEAPRLHRIPDTAHTVAFGLARTVPENTRWSRSKTPNTRSRRTCSEPACSSAPTGPDRTSRSSSSTTAPPGPVEVARHDRARPGSPAINDDHFPGTRTKVPGDYEVRARSADEAAFLAIGEGARTWLIEAAAAGTARMNVKMAEAVTLAKIAGTDHVDRALGDAALHGRFAHPDLASILNANIRRTTTHTANEATSLTQGTGAWAAIGNPALNTTSQQHRHGGGPMSPVTTTNTAAPPLPADLEALMRSLKMPHARALAPDLIATARAQRWEPVEVIKALFTEEAAGRARSMLASRRKAAGFPTGKTFDAWDPAASSIPAPTQQALRTLEWITRRENLVVCGPSGTGKTFFLEALGQQAVEAGMRVAWFRLEDLGVLIRAHRTDDSVTRAVPRILRAELVVIDDIGLLPVATDAAEGLYRVVDAAYEKRSVAISSNLHPAGFDELMPKTLATATVDRLLHHAHVCQTSGDSVRLTQALAGKGVTRLN
jgi:DNA replication protein DnaC